MSEVPSEPVKSLSQRIADAVGDIGGVPHDGYNAFHKYRYTTAASLMAVVGPALSRHGIAISVEHNIPWAPEPQPNQKDRLYTVRTSVTFYGGGETFTTIAYGQGADPADKGLAKAQTMGLKIALQQTLVVATGIDPEEDSAVDQRSAAGAPSMPTMPAAPLALHATNGASAPATPAALPAPSRQAQLLERIGKAGSVDDLRKLFTEIGEVAAQGGLDVDARTALREAARVRARELTHVESPT